jgi:hypothetical protein
VNGCLWQIALAILLLIFSGWIAHFAWFFIEAGWGWPPW